MKSKVKSAARAPAKAVRATKRAAKAEKPAVKKTAASGAAKMPKTAKPTAKSAAKPEKAKPAAKREPKAAAQPKAEKTEKSKQPAVRSRKKAKPEENVPAFKVGEPVLDPIGDTTDGEGGTDRVEFEDEAAATEQATQSSAEVAAFRKETRIEASDAILAAGPGMEGAQEAMETTARNEAVETAAGEAERSAESGSEARGPEKLERLQKILSQAGIASRRRAEEMITEGRVMVNGQVVTTLGTKADLTRDHIRVDGKLLHGAERHRYFLLNKPRGFVTTVSDPEGRPTVMKFFEKMHERLYPVGRLDYQSEGLLLMTNDGELANLLTKAGSGVEKTYLVKVAGRPTEEELEKLRGGVTIERGEAGSGRVRTAPARVRQVRVGDNPWFEVVLIEGRNRELRKMFGAVGHFVEKIRRVGYGPLALDVEPGMMRELTPDEVKVLRLTAEGKMKPKRLHADRMLPKDAGMAAEKRFEKRGGRGGREFSRRDDGGFPRREAGSFAKRGGSGFDKRERKDFGRQGGGFGKPGGGGLARRDKRTFEQRSEEEPKREFRPREGEFRAKPRDEKRPFAGRPDGGRQFGGERRPFGGGRPSTGPKREFRSPGGDRPRFDRPRFDRPRFGQGGPDKPQFDKPRREKRSFDKPSSGKLRIEKVESETGSRERPRFDKPRFDKPGFGGDRLKPAFGGKPRFGGKPGFGAKPGFGGKPKFGGKPGGFSKPRGEGGGRKFGGGRPGGARGGFKRG